MDPRVKQLMDLSAKQSLLNRIMAQKNASARFEATTFTPTVERTLEEEMADINQLRVELMTALNKVLRRDTVAEFVSNLGDESVQFVSQVLPDFLTEVKRFNTTRLDATFLQRLLDRYTDKYTRTKGIDIPMQSGDIASIKVFDSVATGDLRRTLVEEGLATPTEAAEFVSKLKPDELATIDVGQFVDFLKPTLKYDGQPSSLISKYRGFTGSKEIRKRPLPVKDSRAAFDDFKRNQLEAELEAFGAESDLTKMDDRIEEARRDIDKITIDIRGLKAQAKEQGRKTDSLQRRRGTWEEKLVNAQASLGTTGLSKSQLKKFRGVVRDAPLKMSELDDMINESEARTQDIQEDIRTLEETQQALRVAMDATARGKADLLSGFPKETPSEARARIRFERTNPPQEAPTVDAPQDTGDARFYGFGIKERHRVARYAPFGNKLIHLRKLDEGILKVYFPSFIRVVKLPPHKMSPHMHKLMVDALQKGRINPSLLKHLDQQELRVLHKTCEISRVENPIVLKEDEEDLERFEMLRGIIAAGNDNPALIKEMKQLVAKFMHQGRLSKAEAANALIEIMAHE